MKSLLRLKTFRWTIFCLDWSRPTWNYQIISFLEVKQIDQGLRGIITIILEVKQVDFIDWIVWPKHTGQCHLQINLNSLCNKIPGVRQSGSQRYFILASCLSVCLFVCLTGRLYWVGTRHKQNAHARKKKKKTLQNAVKLFNGNERLEREIWR